MGISVPVAYRLKSNKDFWPLVGDVQNIATLKVRKSLETIFLQLMEDVDLNDPKYLGAIESGTVAGIARGRVVEAKMRAGYKAAVVSPERDIFDFDVSVSFRRYRGRIYVIPRCAMLLRDVLDFLQEDPRLDDFWYDNRGDRPEEVLPNVWGVRKKVWEKFAYAPEWDKPLHLDICTWDTWWRLNPYMELIASGKLRDWKPKD
jgi:hypothetical protein